MTGTPRLKANRSGFLGLVTLVMLLACGPAANALTFSLEGSGRVCGGRFSINKTRIIWNTAFSKCNARRAVLLNQTEDSAARHYNFDLGKTQKSCQFKYIAVTTPLVAGETVGWAVTGFVTWQDFVDNRLSEALYCYLTKNDTLQDGNARTAAQFPPDVALHELR